MKKLLLITADPALNKSIHLMVAHERMSLHAAEPGWEQVEVARLGHFDLILLDIDPDGPQSRQARDLLPLLRSAVPDVPVLLFTSDKAQEDKLLAAYAPVECLAKPFHREDLFLRISARLQSQGEEGTQTERFDRLVLNYSDKTAQVDDRILPLTGKEYETLELLAGRAGTTLTKSMFLSHLYPEGNEPEMKIIDVFICKLRKKLAAALGGETFIHTVWGRGYVFRVPERGAQIGSVKSARGQ
jgi:two-component system cell cycle response regulator CtrA